MKVALLIWTFAALFAAATLVHADPLFYLPNLQKGKERRADAQWLHLENDKFSLIQGGHQMVFSKHFQDEEFLDQAEKLFTLEIANVSLVQPAQWTKWNDKLLVSPLVFSLKYASKAWTSGGHMLEKGTINILTRVLINPKDYQDLRVLEFVGFSDSSLQDKIGRDLSLNLNIDRAFLHAIALPALTYYFKQASIRSDWQTKLTQLINEDFCYKSEVLTWPATCKEKDLKP